MAKLESGNLAPAFRAQDSFGLEVNLSDFIGKNVVLYFYPKDNTPGCTTEAQDFSALLEEFENLNCVILGVSPDSQKSHQNFITKQNLKITLLSDPDKQIATSYGAYGEKLMYGKKVMGIIRSSFVINVEGKIAKAYYNVKAKGHAQKVLEDMQKMLGE